MSVWDAVANLFRGPASRADALPFADLRAFSGPTDRYAALAGTLPRFALGQAKWPDFDVARYDTDAYRKLALVFRCLSLISHAAGTAKVRVYDEARDDEEIDDHPMRQLIRQPNTRMGEARFWGTVALRAGVAGFCVVEKVRDGFGDVTALVPLKSHWLKAKPRGGDRYDWEYRIPGVSPVPVLPAENAIPFTWADTPDGSPYGLPPLATAVRDVAILDKLTQYVGNLLDRGGVPMWMFFQDADAATMSQEEIDTWERDWIRRRGGIERRDLPWLVEGIKSAERLSLDPDEIAMECIRDLSDLAICQAFGVPPRKAGVRIGLEHTTQNATAAVEDGEFYRDTIVPLWSRLDDALTTGLLPDFEPPESTVSLEFDTEGVDALQENRNAKAVWVVSGFTGGALSHHALHRELGLPIPETDDFYLRGLATEAIPADDPLQVTTTTTTTTPPPQVPPQTQPNGQQGAEGLARGVRIVALGSGGPGPSERFAQRTAIGAANKRQIVAVAEARQPSIARFLAGQADRVADAVAAPLGVALARSNGHAATAYAASDMDWAKENAQLRRIVAQLHRLAAETAFDAASDHIGTSIAFDLANPKVRDVLDNLGDQIVNITEETRSAVSEIVTAGEQAGKSLAEIASDIREATAFSEVRAMRIARTESMFSYGEASVLAYKESGVVDRAQIWDNETHTEAYGASDGLTCAERNGIIVPLDEAMDHIYADHPNGSACAAPVLIGDD